MHISINFLTKYIKITQRFLVLKREATASSFYAVYEWAYNGSRKNLHKKKNSIYTIYRDSRFQNVCIEKFLIWLLVFMKNLLKDTTHIGSLH